MARSRVPVTITRNLGTMELFVVIVIFYLGELYMTCRMEERDVVMLLSADIPGRRAILKEKGIVDDVLIERLIHSGRNGLRRYVTSNSLSIHTVIPDSQSH